MSISESLTFISIAYLFGFAVGRLSAKPLRTQLIEASARAFQQGRESLARELESKARIVRRIYSSRPASETLN